jgi:hypothetical protein
MRKIADALSQVVRNNPLLELGIRVGLLNLSKTALFIQPLLEARLKKEVQPSAITMGLSRLTRELKKPRSSSLEPSGGIKLDVLTITPGLSVVTIEGGNTRASKLLQFAQKLHARGVFCTVTQGATQSTIILPRGEQAALLSAVKDSGAKVIARADQIAALAVNFQSNYANTPGFFFLIFQKLYLQNINIVELNSTHNELLLYLNENDVELAFQTLYNYFARHTRC